MKVLVTGAKGMLGRALTERLNATHEVIGIDLPECDLTSAEMTDQALREYAPDIVAHCAAMTAVDACESDADTAFAVNVLASANVASACRRHGAKIIAVSTDYVFAGDSVRPYHEWDTPSPKSIYGQSKLAGEQAVRSLCPDHAIVRISWLYGPGGPSFVHTMLRLGRERTQPLKVVSDQIGNPTSTLAVASFIEGLLSRPSLCGIFHATCEGEASWYEFARAIFEEWGIEREISPCSTEEFPRPAPRPANSRLEKWAIRFHGLESMPHWREALREFHAREIGQTDIERGKRNL